jgi:exodeoxyribonuclease V alpha subunit
MWGHNSEYSALPATTFGERLSGLIERVTLFMEENGWAVLKVKAREHRDLVSLVGLVANNQLERLALVTGESSEKQLAPR